ncbi:MAG: hypothetical protein AB7O98_01555 [Hyphomonadaceae bacterium]
MAQRLEAGVEIGIALAVIAAIALVAEVFGVEGWVVRQFCGAEPPQQPDLARYLAYLDCERTASMRYWIAGVLVAGVATGWIIRSLVRRERAS